MRSELERECDRTPKVTGTFTYGAASTRNPVMGSEWISNTPNNWKVTLRYRGRQLTTDFYGGGAVTDPTVADVLSSLILDTAAGEADFYDFAGDFGYDPDSRTAEATWKACRRMARKVRRFLAEDFDRFSRCCEH